MKYWHQQFGTAYPTAEEVPGGRILNAILDAIEASKKMPRSQPEVTCYLISRDTFDRLRDRIPVQPAQPHLWPAKWPGVCTMQGIPIFVYHSEEERVTLRLSLVQAGYTVGEVTNGPVL